MTPQSVSPTDARRARQLKSARRIYDRALQQVTAMNPSTLARFDKAAAVLSRAEGLALRAVPDAAPCRKDPASDRTASVLLDTNAVKRVGKATKR